MIRHVVFDFDGTLVRSNEIKVEAFTSIAGEFDGGLEAMRKVRADGGPQDRFSTFQRFAAQLANGEDARELGDSLARRYSELCEDRISACPYCPGAEQIVGTLRAEGFKVYLNSATPEVALRPILQRRGMIGIFDDLRGLPPDKTENLLNLMQRHAAGPRDTVVVGDGKDDEAAAKAAGCHFISCGCGRDGFDLLSLAELPAALARLNETSHAG